jgi:hypothetical protein
LSEEYLAVVRKTLLNLPIRLGISVGLATVSRYLPKQTPDYDQRQRWKTFLRNHKDGIAAMDFIVVPTVRFRLFYASTPGL